MESNLKVSFCLIIRGQAHKVDMDMDTDKDIDTYMDINHWALTWKPSMDMDMDMDMVMNTAMDIA
jgi:hypothetical protein